jgi:FkbM family methyltransferase
MTKSKLYQMFKNVTPPVIFNFIKSGSLYCRVKKIINNLFRSEYSSKWNEVKNGIIKGRKLYFDPREQWQKEMLNGDYDKFIFDYLKKIDLNGKTIFDIGTHIGFHSLCFAEMVGPKGMVYSFEPNHFNMERFKLIISENKELAGRIKPHEVAISKANGKEIFISSENIEGGASSGGFINSADTLWEKEIYEKETGFKKSEVRIVRLDDIDNELQIKDIPFVIKIDVEGAEGMVLEGGKNFLSKGKPLILLEVHSIKNMFVVTNILKELNYKIEIMKEEKDGRCFICAITK